MPQQSDPSALASSMTPRAFCRGCGYALVGLESRKCPECGREFNPDDPRTFRRRVPRSILPRFAGVMLLLLLAVGMGTGLLWWGWISERESVQKLRGDPSANIVIKPLGPALFGRLLGNRFGYLRDRVEEVSFRNRPLTEIESLNLKSLSHLQSLTFSGCVFEDGALNSVGNLSDLREFNLLDAYVFKPNVSFLAKMTRLQKLNLCGIWIDDAALGHISGLKELNTLGLSRSLITDEGLKNLAGLNLLEELDLRRTRITDAGLEHLRNLKSFRVIRLSETWVTAKGAEDLKAAIPGLVVDRSSVVNRK